MAACWKVHKLVEPDNECELLDKKDSRSNSIIY